MRFETLAVHAGADRDPVTASVAPPIHLSTTFEHGPAGELPHGFIYIRNGNPTEARLEAIQQVRRELEQTLHVGLSRPRTHDPGPGPAAEE